MTHVTAAPGADEIDAAGLAAESVRDYIDGSGVSMDATLGAYAQLAVAASIDALRAVLSEQIEILADQLTKISGRLDALDDV